MRVLQISHNHHITGGSDRVYFDVSRLLEKAGHEVIPFCVASPRNAPHPLDGYFPTAPDPAAPTLGGAVRYVHNREAARKLDALLRVVGPVDVAHMHIYHGKQTPAILPVLQRHNVPIVHTLHEYKLACPVYTMQRDGQNCEACVDGSVWPAIRHRCKDGSLAKSAMMAAEFVTSRLQGDVRRVDQFLCVSDFQRQVMLRAGLPATKLRTLHNFVPIPDDVRPMGDYLLYIGRIEKLKGLATLVEAVRRTGQRLIIAGTGGWSAHLEAAISGAPHITYVGFQDGQALNDLLSGAMAVVVPSEWYENCPMSVLEAKAAGRAVIGARTGGIPELVQDGKDGHLFHPGDVDDLIRVLRGITPDQMSAFGAAARQDAARRFSEHAYLASLTTIYDDLILKKVASASVDRPVMA